MGKVVKCDTFDGRWNKAVDYWRRGDFVAFIPGGLLVFTDRRDFLAWKSTVH